MSTTGHIVVKAAKLVTWLTNGSYTTRKLNQAERTFAGAFFAKSVDLDKVRIAEKASGAGGRAFVAGNTIYIGASPTSKSPSPNDAYWVTFIHEMVHVWQYQVDGPDYTVRAAQAHMTGSGGNLHKSGGRPVVDHKVLRLSNMAYDYATPLVGGLKWSYFNPEAQAELVSDLYEKGFMNVGPRFVKCKAGLVVEAKVYNVKDGSWHRFRRDRTRRVDVFLACLRRGKGAAYSNIAGAGIYVKWDAYGNIIDVYD